MFEDFDDPQIVLGIPQKNQMIIGKDMAFDGGLIAVICGFKEFGPKNVDKKF